MAQFIADRKDVEFVLLEQLKIHELSKVKKFEEFNKKTISMIIGEARSLAIKEILPTLKDGDKVGCKFENGRVKLPDSYKKAYKLFIEGEWSALTENFEYGGQGMPKSLAIAANDYFNGANFSFMMYSVLTHGAALLIETFGSKKQKKLYLKNMYTGKWSGTMLLTEPDAGSDVGNLKTVAKKISDDNYLISGNKIFISSGEHDLTENIIHPVLARIEGEDEGTKGISLFLVPKYRADNHGNLGDFNDVVCTGIEEKMGIHGNATCSLTLGSKNKCIGELLGKKNKGMKMMFVMMNEARLLVGLQGFSCASSSYIEALKYSRERIQGRKIDEFMNPKAVSVNIIQHPDVKRMLLYMKSHVEGMRSLLYYTAYLYDMLSIIEKDSEKVKYQGLIDVLIPICKGYVTDKSFDICSEGIQVYGGYGYTKEYLQEQFLRDCRITMIYEGTNGIQAMDLLGRKLGLNNGKAILDLMNEIQKTITKAKENESIRKYAIKIEECLNYLGEIALKLGSKAMSSEISVAFSFAHTFLTVSGDLILSWMLLWRALISCNKLEKDISKKDKDFYTGQVKSCKYFVEVVLPITNGRMHSIDNFSDVIGNMKEDYFGCK